jgi:hypothetical protein
MGEEEQKNVSSPIEQLKPETAQYDGWKFNEIIVEKINEIIAVVNVIDEYLRQGCECGMTAPQSEDESEDEKSDEENKENENGAGNADNIHQGQG